MARPKKQTISLAEALQRLKAAGIRESLTPEAPAEEDQLAPLPERIRHILQIMRPGPVKSTEMTYLILYDISDHKVRTLVAKYLKSKGCVRIQKSVFLAHSENRYFQEIYTTLQEINGYYQNADSIILVPVNASDVRSMKLIGKNVHIDTITDKPNTLFF
jgi:CRISPR-associated endonuclease Cas2